jgi:hypothetical protein
MSGCARGKLVVCNFRARRPPSMSFLGSNQIFASMTEQEKEVETSCIHSSFDDDAPSGTLCFPHTMCSGAYCHRVASCPHTAHLLTRPTRKLMHTLKLVRLGSQLPAPKRAHHTLVAHGGTTHGSTRTVRNSCSDAQGPRQPKSVRWERAGETFWANGWARSNRRVMRRVGEGHACHGSSACGQGTSNPSLGSRQSALSCGSSAQ